MANKRAIERLKKTFQLRLCFEGRCVIGRTLDVSPGGMLISSREVLPKGSRVTGAVILDNGDEMPFEAEVRWSRRFQGELVARVSQLNRMGVRFITPPGEPYFKQLLKMWNRRPVAPVARAA